MPNLCEIRPSKSIFVHGFLKRDHIHWNKQCWNPLQLNSINVLGKWDGGFLRANFNMLFVNKSRPLSTKAEARYIEITHANLDLFTKQFETLGLLTQYNVNWLDFPRSPQTTIEPVERIVTFVSCAVIVSSELSHKRLGQSTQTIMTACSFFLSLLGEFVAQVLTIQQTFNAY